MLDGHNPHKRPHDLLKVLLRQDSRASQHLASGLILYTGTALSQADSSAVGQQALSIPSLPFLQQTHLAHMEITLSNATGGKHELNDTRIESALQ